MKRTIIVLLSTMLLITGCGATNASNTDTDPSIGVNVSSDNTKDDKQSSDLPIYMKEFVDPDTGVHYLMYSDYNYLYKVGSSGITPRLNSDGTIMVTPKEE